MGTTLLVKRPDREPPSGESGGGGSRRRWRLLKITSDLFEAVLLEGRLSSEGVEVFLDHTDRRQGAFLKPFGDPMAPVRVYVHEFDFTAARLVLEEVGNSDLGHEDEAPRRVRRIWWFTVASALCAALLAFLEIFDFAPCAIKVFCL